MSSKVTVSAIAELAGVSRSTVSRVLNNSNYPVSDVTRAKVMRAMKTLGYTLDPLQSSREKTSPRLIGIVALSLNQSFFGDIIQAIEDTAGEYGHGIVTYTTNGDPERERECLGKMAELRVTGVIAVPGWRSDPEPYIRLEKSGIPVVFVTNRLEIDEIPYVMVDSRQAAATAVRYFADLGFTRIVHLAGPKGAVDSELRLMGYRDALEQLGIGYNEKYVFQPCHGWESGYDTMTSILKKRLVELPFAALFYCDSVAWGAMQAVQDAGFNCPRDVSIMGFDDMPYAEYLRPKLSAVSQPKGMQGELAVNMLINRIEGKQVKSKLLTCGLALRESCAPV
ncbi:MAG TPA: LacI family transcriptional regulator [Firmicutes bacterium]|nr:LacI family transcriptional regulator [Bacillota bacterium]